MFIAFIFILDLLKSTLPGYAVPNLNLQEKRFQRSYCHYVFNRNDNPPDSVFAEITMYILLIVSPKKNKQLQLDPKDLMSSTYYLSTRRGLWV
jgi:hypothetical protein